MSHLISSRRLIYTRDAMCLTATLGAHIYVPREDGSLLRNHRSVLQARRSLLVHDLLRLHAATWKSVSSHVTTDVSICHLTVFEN